MAHRHRVLLTASALIISGCVRPSPKPAKAAAVHPLAGLAGSRVIVLPVQYLSFADNPGWRGSVQSGSAYLASVDDEIAFAVNERVPDRRWVFAPTIVASARRNPVAPDPRKLSAESLRGKLPELEQPLSETLRSQVRALVAVDGTRYALLPVEVRFTGTGSMGRAILRIVLIDSRLARVMWAADLQGAPSAQFGPALAAGVAAQLADLVVAP